MQPGASCTPTTTHSFSSAGTYDVTLVATDAGNASSTPYHRNITVQSGNCPPQDVYFTYSPQSLPSGSPIAFTGHAVDPDGTISSYTWSWGDGTSDTISPTSGGSTTNHTFANPGLYTVQVIARDNLGLAGPAYSLQLVIGVDTTPPTVTLTTPADGGFTGAVDGTAHHGDLERLGVLDQPILDDPREILDADVVPPAGRAGDHHGTALAQAERLQDLPCDLDLLDGIGREGDANRVADPIHEQRAHDDRRLDGPSKWGSGLSNTKVERVRDLR